MSVYRYRWRGLWQALLRSETEAGAVVLSVSPLPWVDVSLVNDALKPELDDAMRTLCWAPESASPAVGPIADAWSRFVRVTALTTTSGTAWTTLLSVTYDALVPGRLFATASFSTSVTVGLGAAFRLVMDGVVIGSSGNLVVSLFAAGLVGAADVAAGIRTVSLEWRSTLGGTIQIDPGSDTNGAALSVQFA
jgi:hypothetical protein